MLKDQAELDAFRARLKQGGLHKDFKRWQKQDRVSRRIAEEERDSKADKKGSRPTFLRPADISGDYDFKRALQTTIGMPEGMTRALTLEDLKAFAANVEQMKQSYKGGITVKQVISLSTQDDIDRANKQIHIAIPTRRVNNLVTFSTNASQESKSTFHTVRVEFAAFNALVFNPDKVKSSTVQNRLSQGKVKFECDCGRFKFWYRYLNTISDTVLGRKEGGYPKIRNPNLTGVACKHILRVMHWIKSAAGRQYLSNALEKERTKQVGARYQTGKNELNRQLAEQSVRANTKRNQITLNLQRELKKIENSAKQKAQALFKREQAKQTRHQLLSKFKLLHEQGILSDAEYALATQKL